MTEGTQWTNLDELAQVLHVWEQNLATAKNEVEMRRQAILAILSEGGGSTFHGEYATISVTHRKTVVVDEAHKTELIDDLLERQARSLITMVPEQIIEQHWELNEKFTEAAKLGLVESPYVEVREALGLQVRYSKGK